MTRRRAATALAAAPMAHSRQDKAVNDPRLQHLTRWFADHATASCDAGTLLAGFMDELRRCGLPVVRSSCHVQTPHPQFRAVLAIARVGCEPVTKRPSLVSAEHRDHLESPLRWVRDHRRDLDERLPREGPVLFPVFDELRREGCTHYVAKPLAFSDASVNVATWVSDHPDGFDRADLALLDGIAPFLRVALELATQGLLMRETVEAYVGHSPARRILAGGVHRGDAFVLKAPMVLIDLAGSTEIMVDATPARAVAALDAFFDATVTPIHRQGGEIVKFIGDAVLATFPSEGEQAGQACRRALASVDEALANVRNLSHTLQPDRALRARAALHFGHMWFGNIGSADRLDFTIVGREVNLLFRLGQLGGRLEEPVLLSETFVRESSTAASCRGRADLKGFHDPQPIYVPSRSH